MAANAQTEVHAIRETYSTWPAHTGEIVPDKEDRDEIMVRALAKEMEVQRCDLVFLTCDDKLRAHTESARIPAIHLRYPIDVSRELNFDPWLLPEFVYELPIIFGHNDKRARHAHPRGLDG